MVRPSGLICGSEAVDKVNRSRPVKAGEGASAGAARVGTAEPSSVSATAYRHFCMFVP